MKTEKQVRWANQENDFMEELDHTPSHDEEEEDDQYMGVYDDDDPRYYDEEKRPSRYDDDEDSEPDYVEDAVAADAFLNDEDDIDEDDDDGSALRRRRRSGAPNDMDDIDDIDDEDDLRPPEIPAFLKRRQKAVSRQREKERKTRMLQQSMCAIVLLVTVSWSIYLTFWIPNRIFIDTHKFFIDDESIAILDNGSNDYSVAFKSYGDIVFTNKNPRINMIMTDFKMEARFLCDQPVLSAASTPICESIDNETWASPFIPMRTAGRSNEIETDEADQRHLHMKVRTMVASDPTIRRIIDASCEQNKNFRVELRAHASVYHQFSSAFSLPVTNFEAQVLSCPTGNAAGEGDKAGFLGSLFS